MEGGEAPVTRAALQATKKQALLRKNQAKRAAARTRRQKNNVELELERIKFLFAPKPQGDRAHAAKYRRVRSEQQQYELGAQGRRDAAKAAKLHKQTHSSRARAKRARKEKAQQADIQASAAAFFAGPQAQAKYEREFYAADAARVRAQQNDPEAQTRLKMVQGRLRTVDSNLTTAQAAMDAIGIPLLREDEANARIVALYANPIAARAHRRAYLSHPARVARADQHGQLRKRWEALVAESSALRKQAEALGHRRVRQVTPPVGRSRVSAPSSSTQGLQMVPADRPEYDTMTIKDIHELRKAINTELVPRSRHRIKYHRRKADLIRDIDKYLWMRENPYDNNVSEAYPQGQLYINSLDFVDGQRSSGPFHHKKAYLEQQAERRADQKNYRKTSAYGAIPKEPDAFVSAVNQARHANVQAIIDRLEYRPEWTNLSYDQRNSLRRELNSGDHPLTIEDTIAKARILRFQDTINSLAVLAPPPL